MNSTVTPKNLLVSVLHKIGDEVRLTDNVKLAYFFNQASIKTPEIFGEFAWHPQYHDSDVLRSTLQTLDIGAGIIRENASIKNFWVTPRVAGSYGRSIFECLPSEVQTLVEALSTEIREAFKDGGTANA